MANITAELMAEASGPLERGAVDEAPPTPREHLWATARKPPVVGAPIGCRLIASPTVFEAQEIGALREARSRTLAGDLRGQS